MDNKTSTENKKNAKNTKFVYFCIFLYILLYILYMFVCFCIFCMYSFIYFFCSTRVLYIFSIDFVYLCILLYIVYMYVYYCILSYISSYCKISSSSDALGCFKLKRPRGQRQARRVRASGRHATASRLAARCVRRRDMCVAIAIALVL